MQTRRSTSTTSASKRSSTPEATQIVNAKFDVRVCRGWVFEDAFTTIMGPRIEGLRQRLVVKVWGWVDYMANGNVSRERFFITHEMFNASYDPFEHSEYDNHNNRTSGANPDFAIFDHRCLMPGFYKVLNKEVNTKGLKVAECGLYYLDVGERYNGCARRDMTLLVTEGTSSSSSGQAALHKT
ncbi:hypothetical protein EDB87DRAFT_1688725 [Lactarius vividus]|nr:hypothetical protein EDB87DRAFT_1688725 [Lactarius vividus]